MQSHAPLDYICPICQAIQGIENEAAWIKQADIFYKDDLVIGFISSKAIKGNEGHPLIVPYNTQKTFTNCPKKPVIVFSTSQKK